MHYVSMVKLSQQLVSSSNDLRETRTERVLSRQEDYKETRGFSDSKQKAEELQKTKFSQISSIEEYEREYNKLSPSVKQFFVTPQQLRTDKVKRISQSIITVNERKVYANQQMKKEAEKYEKKLDYIRRKYSGDRLKRKEVSDDYDEKKKYWEGYIKGLDEGLGKLKQNQDVAYRDINSYAQDLGNYQEAREEAKNDNRKEQAEAFDKLLKTGSISKENLLKAKKDYPKTDWKSPKNIIAIQKEGWVKTYGNLIGTLIVKDKIDDPTLKQYKSIVGEKEFAKQSGEIKKGYEAEYEKRVLEQQNKLYSDWLKEDKTKPSYVDFEPKDFEPIRQDRTDPPDSYREKNIAIISKAKALWDKIPTHDFYYNPPKLFESGGAGIIKGLPIMIAPFKTSEKSIRLREKKEDALTYLSDKTEAQFLGEITRTGLKEKTDKTFQEEYQTKFERKYIKDIIFQKVDFESASKEFEESEEAKIINKKYETAIKLGRAGTLTKEGFTMAGLGLAKVGVHLVPTTTKGVIAESVLIYSGVKVLKAIPPVVTNIAMFGFGTHGLIKGFSTTASPEEKAGGFIEAGISFSLLGYQGIKYLRKPTVTSVKIKAPKVTLKADTVIAKERSRYLVTAKGQTAQVEKVAFGKQKLSQVAVEGRRSIVSTKWRDLVNKYTSLKIDSIYQGIPSQQKGTTYFLEGIRGKTKYTTPSAYQKATDLLIKRGSYTPLQAKKVLRYTAPRVIDLTLEKGNILVSGNKAIGKFEFLTEQPVISVNKALGIKTRGAKSIRDVYDIERTLGLKGNVIENIQKTTMFATKESASYNLLKQAGKTKTFFKQRSLVKSGEIQTSFFKKDFKISGVDFSKEIPFKFQELTGVYGRKQVIPLKRGIDYGKVKTTILKNENLKTLEIDLDKIRGISYDSKNVMTPANIKKTSLSKTFQDETIKTIKNLIKKTKVSKPVIFKDADNVKKIEDVVMKQSKYAGTGLYERTESVGGFDLSSQTQSLQSGFVPSPSVRASIKDLIGVNVASKTGSSLLLASGLKLAQIQKADLKLDTKLKLDTITGFDTKTVLKTDVLLKNLIKQAQAPKLDLKLKQIPALPQKFIIPSLFDTPILRTPVIKEPVIPTFYHPFPSLKREIKKKDKKAKQVQELLYLPDFTSKALGLEPETITEKQARNKLKKILTGFEIRRGVKIKF